MITSIRLSIPPLRITPPLACRCNDSLFAIPPEVIRFTGETGLDFAVGGTIKGFVVSNGSAVALDLNNAPVRFAGVAAKEMLFILDKMDGVSGVLATSDRARVREGVFGF